VTRDPLHDACAAGLSVEIADLGDWAPAALVSEYDREARAIRVNVRVLERLRAERDVAARDRLLRRAVAHELYHHGVATGALAAPAGRAAAERAAEAFASAAYGATARSDTG
jgi:hypothetical protein